MCPPNIFFKKIERQYYFLILRFLYSILKLAYYNKLGILLHHRKGWKAHSHFTLRRGFVNLCFIFLQTVMMIVASGCPSCFYRFCYLVRLASDLSLWSHGVWSLFVNSFWQEFTPFHRKHRKTLEPKWSLVKRSILVRFKVGFWWNLSRKEGNEETLQIIILARWIFSKYYSCQMKR